MITGNVPANFLSNPFLKQLFSKMRPLYKLPARNEKFAKVLVPAEFKRVEEIVGKATNNADFLSLSSDGWKDVSRNKLINVIVHTPKPFLYSTIDVTQDSCTGELIKELLSAEIEKIGNYFKAYIFKFLGAKKIVSIVTDNAANMKLAWELLTKKYPWIVFEGCKAHSVDLAAKDLCKLPFVIEIVENCVEIAKFFR